MSYEQHPLSAAWPAMSESDFQTLKSSIETVGVLTPIVMFEGQVIDGWHRYTAANDLGMPCPTVELDDTDPVDFVKAMNEARRHMTASQRAVAIVSIYGWRPIGRAQIKGAVAAPLAKTSQELADAAGVSKTTIKQSKAVIKAGLTDLVKDGAATVEEAYKIAKGKPAKAKPALIIVAPVVPDDPEYTAMDAAQDQIEGLQDSYAAMAIGGASEEDKANAATLIADLRSRIKTLEATLKAVTNSRDTYQNENAQLRQQINRQRREIDRSNGGKTT